MKFNKRILCGLLCAAMVQGYAFAADESDIKEIYSYFNFIADQYPTEQDATDDMSEIMASLTDDYNCSAEEAQEYFQIFLKEYVGKYQEDNKTEDNTKADEEKEPEQPVITEKNNIDYKVLCDLGIISNDEEGDLDLSAECTRGQFAKMLAMILSYRTGIDHVKSNWEFLDVNEDSPYYRYVAECINRSVVWGYGDGYFKPDEKITAEEASAMLVRSMGYEKEMEISKRDITCFYEADKIGLFYGLNLKIGSTITNADSVELIYNALVTQVYALDMSGNTYQYKEGKAFIEENMRISWYDGYVNANDKTSIISRDDKAGMNQIRVDDNTYSYDSSRNYGDYLAQTVRVFYNMDEETECVAVKPNKNKTRELVISSDLIEEYKNGTLYYYENADADKTKNIKIDEKMHVIFNGAAITENIDPRLFTPQNGSVKFIGKGNGKSYDVVMITSYIPYLYDGAGTADPAIQDIFEVQPIISLDEKCSYYKDGVKCNISDWSVNTVVMAAPDAVTFKDANGKWYLTPDLDNCENVVLDQNTKKITGSVSKISLNSNEITIDGTVYSISGYFRALKFIEANDKYFSIPSTGANVEACLDSNDRVISLQVTSYSTSADYGFLKKGTMATDDETGDEVALFKIFTKDGQHVKLYGAEKIKVYRLWNDSTNKVDNTTYYGKRMNKEKLFSLYGGAINKTLIKYSVNSDGFLDTIYLPEDQLAKMPVGTIYEFARDDGILSKYYQGSSSVNVSRLYGIGSLIFVVPYDIGDTDKFKVAKNTNGLGSGQVEYYDANESGGASAAVYYTAKASTTGIDAHVWDSKICILTEDSQEAYDERTDSMIYSIRCMTGMTYMNFSQATQPQEVEWKINNTEMTTYRVHNWQGEIKDRSEVPLKELKKGDIIRVTDNNNDMIPDGVALLVPHTDIRNDDGSFRNMKRTLFSHDGFRYPNTEWLLATTATNYGLTYGKVVKRNGKMIYVDDNSGFFRKAGIASGLTDTGRVWIYDFQKEKVTPAVMNDIRVGDYVITFADAYSPGEFVMAVRNYN